LSNAAIGKNQPLEIRSRDRAKYNKANVTAVSGKCE